MLLQRNFLFVLPLRLLKISELRLVWTRPTRCLRDFASFSVVGGASAVGWGSKSSVHRYRLVRFRFIQGIVASGRWGRSRRRSSLSPSNCSFASRVKDRILDCRYGTLPPSPVGVSHYAPLLLHFAHVNGVRTSHHPSVSYQSRNCSGVYPSNSWVSQ